MACSRIGWRHLPEVLRALCALSFPWTAVPLPGGGSHYVNIMNLTLGPRYTVVSVRPEIERIMVLVERKLQELEIDLPAPAPPKGNYVSCNRLGNVLFLAGHIPLTSNGDLLKGKVGRDVTVEQAYQAARLVAINIIASLKAELGDLDSVKRITKLVGFVNCVDGFEQQPAVINGASDLLVEVFGEQGRHARSAVGTNALPLNVCVEIEAIVEVQDLLLARV